MPPLPLLNPCCCKALTVAAFINELAFQSANLPVEQVVGLMNKTYYRVCDNRGIGMAKPLRIGPGYRLLVGMGLSHPSHFPRLRVVFFPLRQPALPQKVFVVEQQFVQAGAGDIHKPQFGLA